MLFACAPEGANDSTWFFPTEEDGINNGRSDEEEGEKGEKGEETKTMLRELLFQLQLPSFPLDTNEKKTLGRSERRGGRPKYYFVQNDVHLLLSPFVSCALPLSSFCFAV